MENQPPNFQFARPAGGLPPVVAQAIAQNLRNQQNLANAQIPPIPVNPMTHAMANNMNDHWSPQRNVVIVNPIPDAEIITPSTLPMSLGKKL